MEKNISISNDSNDISIKLISNKKFVQNNIIHSRNNLNYKLNTIKKPNTAIFNHYIPNTLPIEIKQNIFNKNLTENLTEDIKKKTSENTQTQFEYEIKNLNIFSKVDYSNIYNKRYNNFPKLKNGNNNTYNNQNNNKNKNNIKNNNNYNNILNNAYLKTHFNSPLKKYHVQNKIIQFQNPNKKYIVTDDISLVGILFNQTNSNFNNKYKLKYWTSNKRKKEQIKQCFNLLKKGININDINILLNGPKEIISYEIENNSNNIKHSSNFFRSAKYNIDIKKNKINNNVSIKTLDFIRPFTSFNQRINYDNFNN